MPGDMENRFFRSGENGTEWMRNRTASRSTSTNRRAAPTTNRYQAQADAWRAQQQRALSGRSTNVNRPPLTPAQQTWRALSNADWGAPWRQLASAFSTAGQSAGNVLANGAQNVGPNFQNLAAGTGLVQPYQPPWQQAWNRTAHGQGTHPSYNQFDANFAAAARYRAMASNFFNPTTRRQDRQEMIGQYGANYDVAAPNLYHYMPPGIEVEISPWSLNTLGLPDIPNPPKTGNETYGARDDDPGAGDDDPGGGGGGGGGYGGGDYGGGGGYSYTPEPPRWYMNMLSWNIQRRA